MLGGWANLQGASVQATPHLIGAQQPGDAAFHDSLQRWLLDEEPVDLVRDLQLNALDLLDQHQYRMAVVEARTALEIAVDEALLSAMTASAVHPRAAATVLECKLSPDATLRDALDNASIGRKLGRACGEYLGINLLSTSLGPRWQRAKELRENAIHSGAAVSQSEASEAIEFTSEMITCIEAAAAPSA